MFVNTTNITVRENATIEVTIKNATIYNETNLNATGTAYIYIDNIYEGSILFNGSNRTGLLR